MHLRSVMLVAMVALAACGPTSKAAPVAPAAADPAPPTDAGGGGGGGPRTPTTSFELDGNRLVLPGPIVFATGDAAVDEAASAAALWYLHDYLVAKPDVTRLRLEGHGDQPGEDALMLSGERALQVGRWLVAHDIDCGRLLAAAFGDTKPVADPATAEGRAQNRRIEAVNVALRGRVIGGMPEDGGAFAAVPVCD